MPHARETFLTKLALALLAAMLFTSTIRADEPATLAWRDWPALPIGVFDAAGTVTSDHSAVVLVGGLNQFAQAIHNVQVFDVAASKWSAGPPLPTRVAMHAVAPLRGKRVLVVGGKTGDAPRHLTPVDQAVVIDLEKDTATPAPPLPEPMGQPTAHALPDGNVLVIGGSSACVFDAEKNRWRTTIKLHRPREAHASAILADGRVVVVGGLNQDSIEVIDLRENVSRKTSATLPQPTDDLRVIPTPDGRAWILGGQNSATGETNDLTFLWALSPDASNDTQRLTATLTPAPPLGIKAGVADLAVDRIGPFYVALGGESEHKGQDTELRTVRLLDPRVPKVFTLPDLAVPHDDAIALTLGNTVVVFGGFRVGPGLLPGVTLPTALTRVEALTIPGSKLK